MIWNVTWSSFTHTEHFSFCVREKPTLHLKMVKRERHWTLELDWMLPTAQDIGAQEKVNLNFHLVPFKLHGLLLSFF